MSAPKELTIREAVNRWLTKRRGDCSESTVESYWYRLKLFVEWCEENGIETVADLSPWALDEREQGIAATTLHNRLKTLRQFCEYLDSIGATDGLAEAVTVPRVDPADRSDDTRLAPDAARALLAFYRGSNQWNGSRRHVLLELAWTTGARVGGLRALDVRDVDLDERYAEFVHRPETDTPLKNGRGGERAVALSQRVAQAIQHYIERDRPDQSDEHGRQPLLASQRGRPTPGTIRDWMYQATEPCIRRECPHGRRRVACGWTRSTQASHCPSSRSPHQVRTGAITWMLNEGIPPSIVAERVNATVDVIEEHYDKQQQVAAMEERRREHIETLSIHDSDN
jgi:site-specific recombinase XerD